MAIVKGKMREIREAIKEITPIEPRIKDHRSSRNISIIFRGEVPDDDTCRKIEEALKKRSKVVSHKFKESKFVCFLVHLWNKKQASDSEIEYNLILLS